MTSATLSLTTFTLSSTPATLSSMPATLLSTVCATFKTCAVAIRASSCVSLSSLFSASSMSVLPTSFFIYFSDSISVNSDIFVEQLLTCSALPNLFCHNRKNAENLDHYRRDCIHHFFIWWHRHRGINFEASQKGFYAFENVNKSVLGCTNIFSCL